MKKVTILFLVLCYQLCIAQTTKSIKGTVFCDAIPVPDVEVINLASKKITHTDKNGVFNFSAKDNDTLVFYSVKHNYKQVVIRQEDIASNDFTVDLSVKAIDLKEVIVQRENSFHIPFNQKEADKIDLEKAQNSPKNPFIYEGTIPNGFNLVRLGKDISGLVKKVFGKKSEGINNDTELDFRDYVALNIGEEFFTHTLKIKKDEIFLFIEFCDADPKSKTDLKPKNILKVMDFMTEKSIQFKKLPRGE